MSNSSKNVIILNAIVGLCKPDLKWPRELYELGYTPIFLELPVETDAGKQIKPDLVLDSQSQKHSLVMETKGGSIHRDGSNQLDNYATLTLDVVKRKMFTRETEGFDVVIACLADSIESISKALKDKKSEFPLISIHDDKINLSLNKFRSAGVNEIFTKGIAIDLNKVPAGYINFNEDSSPAEIAPHVIQTLMAFAAKSRNHVSTSDITQDAFGELWGIYLDERGKNQMKRKVSDLLGRAAKKELKHYITGERANNEFLWRINISNDSGDRYPAGRLKGISSQSKKFVNRLITEEATGEVQMTLFLED